MERRAALEPGAFGGDARVFGAQLEAPFEAVIRGFERRNEVFAEPRLGQHIRHDDSFYRAKPTFAAMSIGGIEQRERIGTGMQIELAGFYWRNDDIGHECGGETHVIEPRGAIDDDVALAPVELLLRIELFGVRDDRDFPLRPLSFRHLGPDGGTALGVEVGQHDFFSGLVVPDLSEPDCERRLPDAPFGAKDRDGCHVAAALARANERVNVDAWWVGWVENASMLTR